MMIAEFNEQGNLPPGTHHATWEEISERFGTNYYRKKILRGLKNALVRGHLPPSVRHELDA